MWQWFPERDRKSKRVKLFMKWYDRWGFYLSGIAWNWTVNSSWNYRELERFKAIKKKVKKSSRWSFELLIKWTKKNPPTMERLRLWRYKKLTNENVKDEKVIGKQSDDEDYNSCFKLRKTLKVSRRKLLPLIFLPLTTMHCHRLMSNRNEIKQSKNELIINEVASRL
jgi:hypothetical protein